MKIPSGVFLLLLVKNSICIPFDQFYSNASSIVLPTGDDSPSANVSLQEPIQFFGQTYTSLFVNINGIISFDGAVSAFVPTPFPLSGSTILIAPYWADIDTRGIGTVWYRETSSPDLLTRANTQIRNAFPTSTFTATRLFIAGWYTVGYFNANTDLTNTFQCVLATDGSQTFAIFLYADGLIQWTTGDHSSSGGTNGLGGNPAQVGFNAGDGANFAIVPGSRTDDIINIASTSNVGVPGVWIFQISEERIVPSNLSEIFGDPHFMVPLSSKEVLCYSIQGYPGLAFNLISNKNFIINAHFVDSMGDKTEATWIGKLAVIPQNSNKSDAVIFDSVNQEVIMVGQGSFRASVIKQIVFNENGKVSVKFTRRLMKPAGNPTVHVTYKHPQANFDVTFHKSHLNVDWKFQNDSLPGMHGLMGQFMVKGMDIDTTKELLIYPDGHNPVPVTKDTVMTGNPDKPCWKTMNNGIQGEGLIKGNVLDYMVSNILADDFAFKSI